MNPVSPFTDTGLTDATCYQYRLQVADNVGNVGPLSDLSCNVPVEVDDFF